ncbi:hypothetical protein F385_1220 [Pantoea agglomerans 299R]|nr:hypothetical protein F385_1220 [Pantoea agglomerans 299R]
MKTGISEGYRVLFYQHPVFTGNGIAAAPPRLIIKKKYYCNTA